MTKVQTAASIEQAVPFFWVSDIQSSRRFFEEGLGFVLAHQWIDGGRLRWCWLSRDGAAVMLQERASGVPSPGDASKSRAPIVIYFVCKDALAMYRELRARGIQAQRPTVGNGMWVTEVEDPDGNRLFFESATDAADGTRYEERH